MQDASIGTSLLALLVAAGSLILAVASFRRTTWQKPRVELSAAAQVRYKPDVHVALHVSLSNKSAVRVEIRKIELFRAKSPGPGIDVQLVPDNLLEGPASSELKPHTYETYTYRFDGFEGEDGRPYIGQEAFKLLRRNASVIIKLSDGSHLASRIKKYDPLRQPS